MKSIKLTFFFLTIWSVVNAQYSIGTGSGTAGTNYDYVGWGAGTNNSTGSDNSYFGTNAGQTNTTSSYNSMFGSQAGISSTGEKNAFFGAYSGFTNSTGYKNTFIGAISGYFNTTGTENTFTGYLSGCDNSTGWGNTFNGSSSGHHNTTGSENTSYGTYSGTKNEDGSFNTYIGKNAGFYGVHPSENTFVGYSAGFNNTYGNSNTFIGTLSGFNNTTGLFHTFVGFESGFNCTTFTQDIPSGNTLMGYKCGHENTIGYGNSFFGQESGYDNLDGNNNTFFGYQAGYYNVAGGTNIMIGDNAGYYAAGNLDQNIFIGHLSGQNATDGYNTFLGHGTQSQGSGNVCVGWGATGNTSSIITNATAIGAAAIAACSTSVAIGNGAFANSVNTMALGGLLANLQSVDVIIGATTATTGAPGGSIIGGGATSTTPYTLEVNGNAYIVNTWYASDKRYKRNISDFTNGLSIIRKLHPVNYEYRDDIYFERAKGDSSKPVRMNFTSGQQIGFLAQELEEHVPTAVMTRGDGYKAVNYNQLFPVVIQGLKDEDSLLQINMIQVANFEKTISNLKEDNNRLSNQIDLLTQRLNAIEQSLKGTVPPVKNSNETILHGPWPIDITKGADFPYLEQNNPNPFSESTIIQYYLPNNSKKSIIHITNEIGIEIISYPINSNGYGSITVSGNTLQPGTYFYSLETNGVIADDKKMMIIK